ncbi:DUF305 domain-containing protein [Clostridium sp. UBA5988]|uniref:DUF305 domain-containing protein n=2 Tax=unclassified Clostridium TaxID=2614128 RepID=UPI003216AB4E
MDRRDIMTEYRKFSDMIVKSTIIMFGLMYLNTYKKDHVYFSENRVYMALIMGSAMAIIMLSNMQNMYTNRRVNSRIFLFSSLVFVLALWLLRSQELIDDVSWMKSMIPHHSIAILTSERANLKDPRTQDLANRIIESQRQEIEEMKLLIRDIENKRCQVARCTEPHGI